MPRSPQRKSGWVLLRILWPGTHGLSWFPTSPGLSLQRSALRVYPGLPPTPTRNRTCSRQWCLLSSFPQHWVSLLDLLLPASTMIFLLCSLIQKPAAWCQDLSWSGAPTPILLLLSSSCVSPPSLTLPQVDTLLLALCVSPAGSGFSVLTPTFLPPRSFTQQILVQWLLVWIRWSFATWGVQRSMR